MSLLKKIVALIGYKRSGIKVHTLDFGENVIIGRRSVVSRGVKLSGGSIIGRGVKLSSNVIVGGGKIGDYTAVNRNTIVDYAEIGNFCSIGPNCHIGPGFHAMEYVSQSQRLYAAKNILGVKPTFEPYKNKAIIGNDVWIGSGVIIMQGVIIGNGAVVGAGSVVTHDIPPYSIFVGNPARLLKFRFSQDRIDYLEKMDLFGEDYHKHKDLLKTLIEQKEDWQIIEK